MTTSSRTRTGLALLAVTGLLDLTALFGLSDPDSPKPIIIAGCLTGLLTLAGVAYAWRGHRGGTFVVLAALVIDLLLEVPAYFLDAPGWFLAVVTATLALMAIGVVLVAPTLRRPRTELAGS